MSYSSTALYDVEKPFAAYLKADSTLAALVGGAGGVRVYSDGIPRQKTWEQLAPYVNLFRVSGGEPAQATTPEDIAWIQIDAWARDKPKARSVIQAVATVARRVVAPTLMPIVGSDPQMTLLGAWRLQGPTWSPDAETDRPRFVMTLVLTAMWG